MCRAVERRLEPLRWWVRSFAAWFDRPFICLRCGCRYHVRATGTYIAPPPHSSYLRALSVPVVASVILFVMLFMMTLVVISILAQR